MVKDVDVCMLGKEVPGLNPGTFSTLFCVPAVTALLEYLNPAILQSLVLLYNFVAVIPLLFEP